MNPSVTLLLVTWFAVAAILFAPIVASVLLLHAKGVCEERVLIVAPLILVCFLGYLAFFLCYFAPAVARVFSWSVLLASALLILVVTPRSRDSLRALCAPCAGVTLVGLLYLSLLYTPTTSARYQDAAALRFVHLLPPDPILPALLAENLYAGEHPRPLFLDWLGSDRPPLQSGLYLLVLPLAQTSPLPIGLVYQCVGTLAQLAWLPAVWLLARSLGRDRLAASACVLIVAASGFTLHHSIFVWPKLLAGGFTLFAALFILDPRPADGRRSAVLAGLCAGFAWLAHGSSAFALLGLVSACLVFRAPLRHHLPALIITFAFLVLPWVLYQQLLDPPGNRLLKMHLAGVQDVDARSTWETLRDTYRSLTWPRWWFVRKANLLVTTYGSLRDLFDFSPETAAHRRMEEFFYLFRSLGVLGCACGVWLLTRLLPQRLRRPAPPFLLRALLWSVATFMTWLLLMCLPQSTVVHQGAFALPLVLLTVSAVLLLELPAFLRLPFLLWHAAYFASTWLAYDRPAPLNPGMIALTGTTLILLGAVFLRLRRTLLNPAQTSASPARTPSSSAATTRA